jgi:hypothetical protein
MLNPSTKYWISAFNAQGSRGIIVAVHVAVVEALRKKERQAETQEPPKLIVFWVSAPFEC